ncbi:MAG: hypothetical protein BECKG1743E_GA0114224_113171 [Candidatus Kentron sp. G]|nr:MAG: hypothetical protein BECKG1743E_GA0114224_113171 [Candidatus Kentron sp. G]
MKMPLLFLVVASIFGAPSYAGDTDTGDGILYTLSATQDVWLESESTNYNYLEYLIVAQHLDYPIKRSLGSVDISPRNRPNWLILRSFLRIVTF